uniref:Uncharacterized protein n=1 Tax=Glossina pallidipes TaxID=7398 RepID=A0A1B0AC42_GLOPL
MKNIGNLILNEVLFRSRSKTWLRCKVSSQSAERKGAPTAAATAATITTDAKDINRNGEFQENQENCMPTLLTENNPKKEY